MIGVVSAEGMISAFAGAIAIAAVAAWLLGRRSLRRSIDTEIHSQETHRRLTRDLEQLQEHVDRIERQNQAMRSALRGIVTLAAQETIEVGSVRGIIGEGTPG